MAKKKHRLSPEEKKAKLDAVTKKLEEGIRNVFSSEEYRKWLSVMDNFHNYSANNLVLIMAQCPEATHVAGIKTWNEMGRKVKKGEKSLSILAPSLYKKEEEEKDSHGKTVFDENGEPKKKVVSRIGGFYPVSVFDISQTEGEDLPTIGVSELEGSVDKYFTLYDSLTHICPVPILTEDIKSGAKGYFDSTNGRIVLNRGMSKKQNIKTLIHEMAHQKLHDGSASILPATREVQAESVAFAVCQHFGIDTSEYSFGYIAGWSKDKELKELEDSLQTIKDTALEMIDAIEERIEQTAVKLAS